MDERDYCTNNNGNNKMKQRTFSCFNRFYALFFIILIGFFYSVNFDMPGSMENVLEKTFSLLPYESEFMYSVYLLPNVLMCFFTGLIIDKVFGLYWSSFIFGVVSLIGQIIITIGGFCNYYWLILLGRFVNGIGSESVSVCMNCFIFIWFGDKGLNFVFALYTSINRLGSLFVYFIYSRYYNYLEKVLSNYVFGLSTVIFLLMSFLMLISIIILSYNTNKIKNGKKSTKERIVEFPFMYWLIVIMISICNNAVFSFLTVSELFLKRKYNVNEEKAEYFDSLFNIISASFSPLLAIFADIIGRELFFNIFGLISGLISQIIMFSTTKMPVLPIVLYSVFFSILNSCMWSLICYVVKPYQLATAYGLLQCFINLVSAINTILVGYFLEIYGPNGTIILSLSCITVATLFCLTMWFIDHKFKGLLNISACQRRKLYKEL